MNKLDFIATHIGFKAIINGNMDLAFDGELKPLIMNKIVLTITGLKKGGMAILSDDNGKTYHVPPSNVELVQDFPNGFTSWVEAHHEAVKFITEDLMRDEPRTKAAIIAEERGTGGLYELAEDLANQFEHKYKGREWDGEYFDEIEAFLTEKLL